MGKTLRSLSVSKSSWVSWRKKNDVPLVLLVAICNHFNLSVGNFICAGKENGMPVIEGGMSEFCCSESEQEFKPDIFGDYVTHILHHSVDDASRMLGLSSVHMFYRRYRTKGKGTDIKVSEFVEHCNRVGVSPGAFIFGSGIETLEGYDAPDFTNPVVSALLMRIAELEAHIR